MPADISRRNEDTHGYSSALPLGMLGKRNPTSEANAIASKESSSQRTKFKKKGLAERYLQTKCPSFNYSHLKPPSIRVSRIANIASAFSRLIMRLGNMAFRKAIIFKVP